jgi:hypothetical protein
MTDAAQPDAATIIAAKMLIILGVGEQRNHFAQLEYFND